MILLKNTTLAQRNYCDCLQCQYCDAAKLEMANQRPSHSAEIAQLLTRGASSTPCISAGEQALKLIYSTSLPQMCIMCREGKAHISRLLCCTDRTSTGFQARGWTVKLISELDGNQQYEHDGKLILMELVSFCNLWVHYVETAAANNCECWEIASAGEMWK